MQGQRSNIVVSVPPHERFASRRSNDRAQCSAVMRSAAKRQQWSEAELQPVAGAEQNEAECSSAFEEPGF